MHRLHRILHRLPRKVPDFPTNLPPVRIPPPELGSSGYGMVAVEGLVERNEISRVLAIHSQAYKFLLWLDRRACHDPDVLASDNVAAIRDAETCTVWLHVNRQSLPAELTPSDDDMPAFARMLGSFFETSFHVEYVAFGGQVLEARLARGADRVAVRRTCGRSSKMVLVHALRRLAQSESIPMDQPTARRLANRASLRDDALIWAYALELARRANGVSKGTVIHDIWRKIERTTRLDLTADHVWEGRQRLVAALRESDAPNRSG